jgi:hypothetical protein
MRLQEALKQARLEEKNNNKHSIVYQVFDNGSFDYVGIGGKGKRKGSGRLAEHKGESVYSSFRFQYYMNKWDEGFTRKEVNKMWDKLEWKITQFNTIEEADSLETELIKEFNPKFNRDKK